MKEISWYTEKKIKDKQYFIEMINGRQTGEDKVSKSPVVKAQELIRRSERE